MAFPLVLWFVATFFLLGDIGRWLDDWFYVQRVPETGDIRALVLDRPVHFWRPLYKVVVPSLATLLDGHVQLHHLICAAAHGLNAVLLWRLLLTVGIRRLAASIGALLFLVFPAPFEVVFWLCNLPTSLSMATCLLGLLFLARMANRRHGLAWASLLLGPVAFFAAALNEQPPALLLTAPLVWHLARNEPVVSLKILRCWPLAVGVAGFLALYALCHHRFAPTKPSVDGDTFFVAAARLPGTFAAVVRWATGWTFSTSVMRRELGEAVVAAASHPVRSTVALAFLLSTSLIWVRWHGRRGHEVARGHIDRQPAKPGPIVLVGVVFGLTGIAPIVLTSYWLNPRVLYAPSIGMAFAVAGLLLVPGAARPGLAALGTMRRRVAAGIAACGLTLLAFMMVGVQQSFQRRTRMDSLALSRLQDLVPSPVMNAVFVPVDVKLGAHPLWAHRYDRQFWSVFHAWWSSSWVIRLHYRRSDIDAGYAIGQPAWRDPNIRGVHVNGVGHIAWDKLIPFSVDENGHIAIITRVRWVTPSGESRMIGLRHLPSADTGRGPTFDFPALVR